MKQLAVRTSHVLVFLSGLGLLGCGDAEPPKPPAEPPPTSNRAPTFEPVAQQGEMLLVVPPHRVEPGTEVQWCWEMDFPSDVDVDLDRIRWEFADGSHHLHVYLAGDGAAGGAPSNYECFNAIDFEKWHLLVATQNGELDWKLPPETGLRVKGRQRVLMQTHYLNTNLLGTDGGWAYGAVHLHEAAPGSVKKRIGAVFGQNRAIELPPRSTSQVAARCELPAAGQFVAMTGHFHTHGTAFRLYVDRAEGPQELLYQTIGFDEPEWTTYPIGATSPSYLRAGDSFRWECDYNNDTDVPIKFGPREDTEEHCNLFAFYMLDEGQADFAPCVWTGGTVEP